MDLRLHNHSDHLGERKGVSPKQAAGIKMSLLSIRAEYGVRISFDM